MIPGGWGLVWVVGGVLFWEVSELTGVAGGWVVGAACVGLGGMVLNRLAARLVSALLSRVEGRATVSRIVW